MKRLIFILLLLPAILYAQEALKSIEEEYYDFLSLTGVTERPTLGYRTLSDNIWKFNEVETFEENEDGTFTKVRVPGKESNAHIWNNNNLGTTYTLWEAPAPADNWFTRGINQAITARIYGPEWFNSYNTTAPYGQNDGALWQGRGYNTSLTAGVRLEGYGFELTFKPQVCWMENREFEYIKPNYNGINYAGKAEKYGYYGVTSIDAPQRFGDESFWNFDLGDTEVRWTWNTFTVGFGTQSIWLGPAKLNPIIHSNNAPSYPKFDIGFRKTKLTMPYFGWDLGDIEARGWWGKLSESDWFDNDDSNDDNLISGMSIYYQFPYLKELTFGFNRTMLSKWNDINSYSLFKIYVPFMEKSAGSDNNDQRASITIDYYNKKAQFDLYFEWGRNDFSPDLGFIIRYPFHTEAWTIGINKSFTLPWKNLYGRISLELTKLECSQDYDRLITWYSTFYAHHIITQGYTNQGQWLGAGNGTGGNSQYLGFTIFHKTGNITLFAQRRNPDLDYTYFIDSKKYLESFAQGKQFAETNIRVILDFGFEINQFIIENILLNFKFTFERERNPINISKEEGQAWASELRHNLNFRLELKYQF